MENMEEIYRAHARTVYKFLLSLCHDPETAEDDDTLFKLHLSAIAAADRLDNTIRNA